MMKGEIMNNNKKIAKKLWDIIGGTPKVVEYWDNDDKSKIDIYIGVDKPYEGVNSYGTIGLSNYDIGLKVAEEKELRVEFISACGSEYEFFGNIIASCGFNIINNQFSCSPGTVYPGVICKYSEEYEMKHVMFVSPFLWDNPSNMELEDKIITWLMPIPISDKELKYLQNYGSDELQSLFEKNDIDIFDMRRESVL